MTTLIISLAALFVGFIIGRMSKKTKVQTTRTKHKGIDYYLSDANTFYNYTKGHRI